MLKFIELQQKLDSREVAFQNILCWSLSSQYDELYVRIFLFQNILCWSLSRKGSKNERKHKCISKHLMLKFIVSATHWLKAKYLFQNILCWSLSWSVRTSSGKHLHFKTSYVEVYHPLFQARTLPLVISKHLMLKFIVKPFTVPEMKDIFQNILCWSLSK